MMTWLKCVVFIVLANVKNVHSQSDFQLRFAETDNIAVNDTAGEVDIFYDNKWWLISSHEWTLSNTNVLCKAMGFPDFTDFYFVQKETLENCTRRVFKCTGTEKGLQYCNQFEDYNVSNLSAYVVHVVCSGSRESAVRLIGGMTLKEGRVEVYHDGEWGTVCMRGMVITDATVICRSVGYDTTLAKYMVSAVSPQATGQIWIDDLPCVGSESHITECLSGSWGNTSCKHVDDIYVSCYLENDIRLNSNFQYGILEIYHTNVWGSVCNRYIYDSDMNEAKVACRSLGFTNPVISHYTVYNNSKVWLSDLSCNGYESSLVECNHADWSTNYCRGTRFGVACAHTSVIPTTSVPECEQRCYNGYCDNNTCLCYESNWYGQWCEYLIPTTPVPKCEQRCYNGYCDNNTCLCETNWHGQWCEYSYYVTTPTGNEYGDDGNVVAAIVVGCISGLILLTVAVILFIFRDKLKHRTSPQSTDDVVYTSGTVNVEGQMPFIQPTDHAIVPETVDPEVQLIHPPAYTAIDSQQT